MSQREANCNCNKVKIIAGAEPGKVSICHCKACQRRTGSIFGVQASFDKNSIIINGETKSYTRTGDSGRKIEYHFCPECGDTIYYQIEKFSDKLIIPVGLFADSEFPPPVFSVYEERMHNWVEFNCLLERLF